MEGSSEGNQERSLERLLEIAHRMNLIHDRDLLFDSVSRWLRELFDAENSFVVLMDENGNPELRSLYMREPGNDGYPISDTIIKRAIAARCPITIDDTADVPDLSSRVSIERFHIRSVLCAPLMVGERVIGVLQFDHRSTSTRFPERDRRLLQLFADQAATAFHNLELIEKLNEAVEEVQEAHGKLVQSERLSALGEMATGMAHNFNNTLFIALGFCDVLLARKDLEPDVRDSLGSIRGCALDAANTVRRLQDFARGGAVADAAVVLCSPAEILTGLAPLFTTKLREVEAIRDIRITIRTNLLPTPYVAARPADLREILINLIFNAIDAMSTSGEIELSSGTLGERVFLRVKDEGSGMAPDVSARVFEPFFSTKDKRGAGLGLSTSWSIVRRLQGEMEVSSRPGAGSTFSIWLPIAAPAQKFEEPPCSSEVFQNLRVLVIDDDAQVLRTIGRLLEILGHECEEYTDPREGLAAFSCGGFDVVVTDLGMQNISGMDVAREIHRANPDVPVLVVTGWGDEAMAKARAGEGVHDVLSKPLSLEDIRATLARARRV